MLAVSALKFNKAFLRDFWRLFKPYWVSEEKHQAYFYLILTIVFVVGGVRASVYLNQVNKEFYDALQAFNKPDLIKSLQHLAVSIIALLFCFGYAFYFNGLLSVKWRRINNSSKKEIPRNRNRNRIK